MNEEESLAHDYAKNMAIYNACMQMNVYGKTIEELAEIKLQQETSLANANRAQELLREVLKNKPYTSSLMEQ